MYKIQLKNNHWGEFRMYINTKKLLKNFSFLAVLSLSACDIALSDSVNPYTKNDNGGFTYFEYNTNEFRVFYKGKMGQEKSKVIDVFNSEVKNLAIKSGANWYKINSLEINGMRKNYRKYSAEQQAEIDKSLSPAQINAETIYYINAYLLYGKDVMPEGAISVK